MMRVRVRVRVRVREREGAGCTGGLHDILFSHHIHHDLIALENNPCPLIDLSSTGANIQVELRVMCRWRVGDRGCEEGAGFRYKVWELRS